MNPIPLTSPAGVIFRYACGVCLNVSSSGETVYPQGDAPLADLVERSRDRAERCCTCYDCDDPLPLDYRNFGGTCRGCTTWRQFLNLWHVIGTSLLRGFTSGNEYADWCNGDEGGAP